jgi:hypothetical protein
MNPTGGSADSWLMVKRRNTRRARVPQWKLSKHCLERMTERSISEAEVADCLTKGARRPARDGCTTPLFNDILVVSDLPAMVAVTTYRSSKFNSSATTADTTTTVVGATADGGDTE